MLQDNYQKYEVNVKFSFESEVFQGDPDDVYELADLEKASILDILVASLPDVEIKSLTVEPVILET